MSVLFITTIINYFIMTLFDCFQPRPKRKLNDYVINTHQDHHHQHHNHNYNYNYNNDIDDDLPSSLNTSSIQQNNNKKACSSEDGIIQLFVRMINGKTLVIHSNNSETVKSIHLKIHSKTKIPISQQRLIYNGKHLQWDHTLSHYNIPTNSSLQFSIKVQSTLFPQASQLLADLLRVIRLIINHQTFTYPYIRYLLDNFLKMVNRDIDSASVYFDMFVASCAPEALVMLYLYDKHRALDSVTHFFTSSKDELELPIYYDLLAPIVLHFCKLLRKGVVDDDDDPLYEFCRTTLGSMLNDYTWFSASKIALHDLFPFVDELANKLSQGLVSSVDSIIGPSSTDVHDFETFSRFVIKAIVDPMALETLIPVHYHRNHPRYNHQLSYLYSLFLDLLEKLQTCLAKVGDDIKFNPKFKRDGGWDQYFSILKLLHYIAQLYEGAEEIFWTSLKPNKAAFSYIIVNYAKRRDEGYKWILDRKDMTDFKSRRHLVMMLLPEVTHDYDNLHEMLINRSNLLAESFESITGAEIAALHGPMHIGFINEEATGPGVLREWFLLVCQAIFNPQNALFVACPTDRRRFFPNPLSKVDPMHLEYFIFAGRVIALALMRKMQVGIVFSRAFFLQLAGIDVSLEDIKDADPYLYSSCKQILDMDPCVIDQDVLGLTFIWEVEELGSKKVVELLPDGKIISVNSVNRKVYIDLLIRHQFVTSIAKQVSKFAQGFADIVSNEETRKLFYKSLELEDLDGMLHGSESVISVDDWKAHTEYDGYKETDPQICWFWQIVGEMSAAQRKVLLFFWTSVKYLPVEGFCGLASRLCITKTNETIDLLPSSHTCFYQICFPAYPSMTVMQQRLNIITQEHIGCSFGTW